MVATTWVAVPGVRVKLDCCAWVKFGEVKVSTLPPVTDPYLYKSVKVATPASAFTEVVPLISPLLIATVTAAVELVTTLFAESKICTFGWRVNSVRFWNPWALWLRDSFVGAPGVMVTD